MQCPTSESSGTYSPDKSDGGTPGPDGKSPEILENRAFLEPPEAGAAIASPKPTFQPQLGRVTPPICPPQGGLPELTELGDLAPIYSQRN